MHSLTIHIHILLPLGSVNIKFFGRIRCRQVLTMITINHPGNTPLCYAYHMHSSNATSFQLETNTADRETHKTPTYLFFDIFK